MDGRVRDLLACPACASPLSPDWACECCSARFDVPDGIPNLRLPGDGPTDAVRRFYDEAPFPGYPLRDTLTALRARAERSVLAALLDRAVPPDARMVDVGCGTGQMCLYLSRADRVIVGVDLSRQALLLAAAAARRFDVRGVQFIETDLRRPALRAAGFDIVYSSGVLHHTSDPRAAFASVARLARPGGWIIIGLYNALARLPARARRLAARCSAFRLIPGDRVLRDRQHDAGRRHAWLRDQYCHPEEHCHTLATVQRWFRENEIEYLRTYPSAVLGDECPDLFAPAADNWRLEGWLAQLAWIRTLGREGGLFFTIGRRRPAEHVRGRATGAGCVNNESSFS